MAVALAARTATTSRLVLRDGSTAGVRAATIADRAAVRRFFSGLSAESLYRRFLGPTSLSDELLTRLCDSQAPQNALTLIVCRRNQDDMQIIGVGSYFAESDSRAEVAFAVDDRFHGRGIATALLERLVSYGRAHNFESFSASVLPDNSEMLDVFRDSGFETLSTTDAGVVQVRLSLQSSTGSVTATDERERQATIASLHSVLKPRAVAVIGASRRQSHLGRRVFASLKRSGFRGPIYPVNPSVPTLDGSRCYASARDVPPGVDLAVVAVPRDAVLDAVDDCAVAGIAGIVVISAGFAETDARGRELQAELVERVRGYGMRLVGPNCMGVINTDPMIALNASFAEHMPRAGSIALASQSGGLGLAVLRLAAARQLGLSTFVSLGNKADISGNDILLYGESDPGTSVVLLYLESFGNPRRFGQIARRVSRTKPIVVVKSGRTAAGLRAAASHTAGLAASELAVDGLFRQAGVIRADTIDEMFDLAAFLDAQPLPPGRRIAIVTNAGGPGILAADACVAGGLNVQATAGARTNPVDLIASADGSAYGDTIAALLASDDVDAVMVIYTTIDSSRTDEMLAAISASVAGARERGFAGKPVAVCTMATATIEPLRAGAETLPVYEFPEQAARAIARAADYAEWRSTPLGTGVSFEHVQIRAARALCRDVLRARGETWLTTEELHQLLRAADIQLAPGVIAHSADEAAALARVFGYPVVAKIVSANAVHKTELGGVRLNLANDSAVRSAYANLCATATESLHGSLEGILIQPMAHGTEILVGLSQDPVFGPLVAFGLGGTQVELFRDVAFRIAPLTDRDADEMIRGVRGFALLRGYRNTPPADLDALRNMLLKVSCLGAEIPELAELEFNPVMALPEGQGCRIVDARARVRHTDYR